MDIKKFAHLINNRECGDEITTEEEKIAQENNWAVVFGASDDLCELRGCLNDEYDCFDGGELYLNSHGVILLNDEKCDNCVSLKKVIENSYKINILWCENEFLWSYQTEIPHETFVINKDCKPYCQGIVFDMKDLK